MDFVVRHGTTQSPAGWDSLTTILTARSHRRASPDLPSGHPEWGAADCMRAVRGPVPAEFDRPVVATHSGAGLLLPAVAAGLAVRHLAWLGLRCRTCPAGCRRRTAGLTARTCQNRSSSPKSSTASPESGPRHGSRSDGPFADWCLASSAPWAVNGAGTGAGPVPDA
ncbi:alpha/beta hydrolase [Amycolatopsis methanolica 239]|uniref:Alpha/beta hydrolase n=1 Tax=Amycolatopsis methanolica 239 TaxID=1068978 RepID=A0A076MSB1_AMYME|nr:alpha/beta hydrolase [Amycolatopsis methanolica 239]